MNQLTTAILIKNAHDHRDYPKTIYVLYGIWCLLNIEISKQLAKIIMKNRNKTHEND